MKVKAQNIVGLFRDVLLHRVSFLCFYIVEGI